MRILKTKTFQEAAKTILMAVDNNAANIELVVKENYLYFFLLHLSIFDYYFLQHPLSSFESNTSYAFASL